MVNKDTTRRGETLQMKKETQIPTLQKINLNFTLMMKGGLID